MRGGEGGGREGGGRGEEGEEIGEVRIRRGEGGKAYQMDQHNAKEVLGVLLPLPLPPTFSGSPVMSKSPLPLAAAVLLKSHPLPSFLSLLL